MGGTRRKVDGGGVKRTAVLRGEGWLRSGGWTATHRAEPRFGSKSEQLACGAPCCISLCDVTRVLSATTALFNTGRRDRSATTCGRPRASCSDPRVCVAVITQNTQGGTKPWWQYWKRAHPQREVGVSSAVPSLEHKAVHMLGLGRGVDLHGARRGSQKL